MLARRSSLSATFLALAIAGCAGQFDDGGSVVPLFDGEHAPDVLTESRTLDLPPSTRGNRFLRGWRGQRRRRGEELTLSPDGAARLEIVQLAARRRVLALRTLPVDAPPGAAVRVTVGGRALGTVPLARTTEISLPEDLPIGRLAIDLDFPDDVEVLVTDAALQPVLPAGETRFADGDVEQSGASLIDVVRRLPRGAVLTGSFAPPAGVSSQRFTIALEDARGWHTAFEWRGGLWNRLLGRRELVIPVAPEGGLVRVRFAASGSGPAARWERLRLHLPELPPVAASSPPAPKVVILYVLDALRADSLTHLGGAAGISPNIDRLAADGVTFTRHWSVAPNTLPSTKALFTGQAFREAGGAGISPDGPETLAEVFAAAGYRTAAFSGNGWVSADFGTIRGFATNGREWIYADQGDAARSYNDNAERVQHAALRWLDGVDPRDRVFLYLHTVNPHNPYTPPADFERRFADVAGSRIDGSTRTLQSIQHFRLDPTPQDRERLRQLYAACVAYNDAQIATLVAEIERRYPAGDALLIVTADHGDELFDHDGVLHGYTLYDEQLQIPMIFWWPRQLASAQVDAATENLDLHETLRALVGAPPSGRGEGRSLWPLLSAAGGAGKEVTFAAASSVKGGIFMARSDRMKLIWAPRRGVGWGLGEGRGRSHDPEYLFDLEEDPSETVNLAGDHSLEASWLRSRLLSWIERGRALEAASPEAGTGDIGEETRANLRALGYVE